MIIQHHVVSTRKSPLFIAAMVFFFFVLILIDRTDLISMKTYLGLVGLVLFSLLYYLLGKVKIILDNPGISFQYPLKKDVHIPWPEIIKSKLQWDFDMHGGNAYWTFSLLAGKTTGFSPSFYSRKSLRLIAEALIIKCPNAQFDKRILKMSEGKFPWYLF